MKIFLLLILLVQSTVTNLLGIEHSRAIIQYEDIFFEPKDNDNYVYIMNNDKKYLFDIYEENGGLLTPQIVIESKDILTVLLSTHHNIPSPDIKCEEVNAIYYSVFMYKRYRSFILKLFIDDISGYDGNVMCENIKYPYKTKVLLQNKVRKLNITDNFILNSLETFLKLNYAKKYESKFTFKDSTFNIGTVKDILSDITLRKMNLTNYNNIAYYLQKAGANEEAVYLLGKILEKFPNRTVAYYNIGDAYWELGKKEKAVKAYHTYIEQMKEKGKGEKIPKVVLGRVGSL